MKQSLPADERVEEIDLVIHNMDNNSEEARAGLLLDQIRGIMAARLLQGGAWIRYRPTAIHPEQILVTLRNAVQLRGIDSRSGRVYGRWQQRPRLLPTAFMRRQYWPKPLLLRVSPRMLRSSTRWQPSANQTLVCVGDSPTCRVPPPTFGVPCGRNHLSISWQRRQSFGRSPLPRHSASTNPAFCRIIISCPPHSTPLLKMRSCFHPISASRLLIGSSLVSSLIPTRMQKLHGILRLLDESPVSMQASPRRCPHQRFSPGYVTSPRDNERSSGISSRGLV